MKRDEMKVEMYKAMRDLLGAGCIPAYYEQAAADFIAIAEAYKSQKSDLEHQAQIERMKRDGYFGAGWTR